MRPRLLLVGGTRPEVLKLAPLVRAIVARGRLEVRLGLLEQQRELLAKTCADVGLTPEACEAPQAPEASGPPDFGRLRAAAERLVRRSAPDAVLVQGDTSSAAAGALAAYGQRRPLAHVEAGLRTHDLELPFPEEGHRVLIDRLAQRCYAPTDRAWRNLLAEGVRGEHILISGNTGIDALLAHGLPPRDPAALWCARPRAILVTAHRRENYGAPLARMRVALERLLAAHRDLVVHFIVHPNPRARVPGLDQLARTGRLTCHAPLPQAAFLELMTRMLFVLTDSGGVQEEAPYLGVPVLILRTKTERPEGLAAGTARLVGCDPAAIWSAAQELLLDRATYLASARRLRPYGDGRAGERIAADLARWLQAEAGSRAAWSQAA